jgi:hypothetical protein
MKEREKLEAVQIHARSTDSSDYSISSRSSSVTNVLDHSDIKSSTFDKFHSTNRPATEENLYDSVSASEYQNNEESDSDYNCASSSEDDTASLTADDRAWIARLGSLD